MADTERFEFIDETAAFRVIEHVTAYRIQEGFLIIECADARYGVPVSRVTQFKITPETGAVFPGLNDG